VRVVADSWRQGLFADLLRSIRLSSSFWFRPELRAPWGFSISRKEPAFHIVTQGNCWLEVKRLAKPVRLSAGDFVVVPHGDWHAMRDAPATRPVDFFYLAEKHAPNERGVFCVGGNGAVTKLVCGAMQFENGATDPLLPVLPPLLHVTASDRGAAPRLRLTVERVIEELESAPPGAEVVVTRLADILFIEAVRAYLDESKDTATSGWLAALRDQQVGQALAFLHAQPDYSWTVESLARRVSLSRSAFATKFAQLVGEPPLRYLTRLRLNVASERLHSDDAKLSAIAAAVGYESVAAFVKAFKRYLGVTPGEYRRAHPPGRMSTASRELKTTRRTGKQR